MSSVPPKITLTITPLYSVRLNIFEWFNCFFWRHLNQIQENRAGRNFITSSCEFTVHYVCRNAEVKLKSTTTRGFNLGIINSNAILVQWKLGLWKLHIPKTDVTKKGPITGHRINQNMVGVLGGQRYICRHLEQSHNYVSFVYESVSSQEKWLSYCEIIFYLFLICWRRLSWSDGDGKGFSLEYPAISLHAICRDTSQFQYECIYCMMDSPLDGKNYDRDANLWKPKIWRLSLWQYPPENQWPDN